MKINKSVLMLLVLFFVIQTAAFAQFTGIMTGDSFEKQPALTEADIKGFINSEKTYNHMAGLDENADVKAVDAYVKKNTGLSLERYLFTLAKLSICYSVMFEMDAKDEKALNSIFEMMPSYFRANAAEQALIRKYAKQINETFLKMQVD